MLFQLTINLIKNFLSPQFFISFSLFKQLFLLSNLIELFSLLRHSFFSTLPIKFQLFLNLFDLFLLLLPKLILLYRFTLSLNIDSLFFRWAKIDLFWTLTKTLISSFKQFLYGSTNFLQLEVTAHYSIVAFVIGNLLDLRPFLEKAKETRMKLKGEWVRSDSLLLSRGERFMIAENITLHWIHLHHK